jgi:GH43 family beta-xylosidase
MTPSNASATWANPLLPQRADPHLSLHDGRYWFTASVPAFDAIELRAADSLAGLAEAMPHTVWRKHDFGPMSWHVWAPELHRIGGRWLLYFAASERDDIWKLRMYVLECEGDDPLSNQWIERGRIQTPIDSFALDATTFEHAGTRYLLWAQKDPAIEGNTNLYIGALGDPWTLRGAPVRISRPDLPWERIGFLVNEGPAVLVRNGKVIVAYSASATDANYCMGLLWAEEGADLLDAAAWNKTPHPVFASANGQYGPGHNSFTTTPDGRTDLLVYHARDYRDIVGDPLDDPNRHARAQAFGWGADGLPEFGAPVADGPYSIPSSLVIRPAEDEPRHAPS